MLSVSVLSYGALLPFFAILIKYLRMKTRCARGFACFFRGPLAHRPAHERSAPSSRTLLSDHAYLLRECAAAPWPCLFDDRLRCDCAAEAGPGRRNVVFNRH